MVMSLPLYRQTERNAARSDKFQRRRRLARKCAALVTRRLPDVIPDLALRRGVAQPGPQALEAGCISFAQTPRAEPVRLSHPWSKRATRSAQERKQWMNEWPPPGERISPEA